MPPRSRSVCAANRAAPFVPAEIEDTLKDVEQFYQSGLHVTQKLGADARFGRIRAEAGTLSDAIKLRNARAFTEEYSFQEFQEFCEACRRHSFVLGTSLLTRLLSIPKEHRLQLQAQAIEERWTLAQLNVAIRDRFGSTKPWAGKRVQTPQNRAEALYKLHWICHRWAGLYETLSQPNESQFDLSGELWQRVTGVNAGMSRLGALLKKEMNGASTTKKARRKK